MGSDQKLNDTTGRQTDVPVVLLETMTRMTFYDLIGVFYRYTGKLGNHIELVGTYNSNLFVKGLLQLFDQQYLYDDITKIQNNGSGVLCIASETTDESQLDAFPKQLILAVYIDEYASTPDIMIRIFKIPDKKVHGINICTSSKALSFTKINLVQILLESEMKVVAEKNKGKVTETI